MTQARPMAGHDIIVIGASAGGVTAITQIVRGLPADLPAAVFLVWHMAPQGPNGFARVLARSSALPVGQPVDAQKIRPGHIYMAQADRHLVLEEDRVRLTHGPKENRFRPAIDPLFRSAAYVYGSRVIGVILTGALDDGTAGLWAVKSRGGIAVVQDPTDAFCPSMPRSALTYVSVDHCVPVAQMAPLLAGLAYTPAGEPKRVPDELVIENKIALEQPALANGVMKLGDLSPYTCPDCHGTLLQLKAGGVLRFRCHTGHAYTVDSLLAELTSSTEEAIWNSVRALEESTILMRHVARHLREAGETAKAAEFDRKAEETTQRSTVVRQAAVRQEQISVDQLGAEEPA